VKPARFVYHRTETAEECVALLAEHGDAAKILAGGQSLIPMMNLRLAQPEVLVDIGRVESLRGIRRDGALTIGATTPQAAVMASPDAAAVAPLVAEAVRWVGHPANRNRGTFGGSAAHADPAAEIPAVLLALDAELVVTGPRGERTIAADDFFQFYLTTALAPDELLQAVRLPLPSHPERTAWAFIEVARRHGDFALVGAAFVAHLDEDGRTERARVALLGVGSRALRAEDAEAALRGQRLDDPDAVDAVAQLATVKLDPPSDLHASAQYRKDVAAVLVRRAIRAAQQRLGGAA